MKILKKIFSVALTALLFISCENEPAVFEAGMEVVGFDVTSGSLSESVPVKDSEGVTLIDMNGNDSVVAGAIILPVYISGTKGASVTVTFDFDTAGLVNKAVEGVDFELMNTSKTLTYPNGFGYDTIFLKSIDNAIFEGNKAVNVTIKSNSKKYPNSKEDTYSLTLVDDEHPLKLVIGEYMAAATEIRGGAVSFSMEISTMEGSLEMVWIKGMFSAGPYAMPFTSEYLTSATVDLEEMTISIPAGQEYPSYGFGPTVLEAYDRAGAKLEDGALMIGTIDEDGTIHITHDYLAFITEGNNEGLYIAGFELADGETDVAVWTKK